MGMSLCSGVCNNVAVRLDVGTSLCDVSENSYGNLLHYRMIAYCSSGKRRAAERTEKVPTFEN